MAKATKLSTSIDSSIPATRELERAIMWAGDLFVESEQLKPSTKRAPVTVLIERQGKFKRCNGTFQANSWVTVKGRKLAQIGISSEHLLRDVVDVVGTAIHERAHLLAHELGIEDCSPSNGRHKREFKQLVEQVGLDCWSVKGKGSHYGFGFTSVSDGLRERIIKEFKPDYTVFNKARIEEEKKSKTSTKLRKYSCECESDPNIYATHDRLELKVPKCGDCGSNYKLAN